MDKDSEARILLVTLGHALPTALHSIEFIVLAAVGAMKDVYARCCLVDLLHKFGSAEVAVTMSPLLLAVAVCPES